MLHIVCHCSHVTCAQLPTRSSTCSCLVQALVERYTSVECMGVTPEGEPLTLQAHGWQARILQHEVDHLQASNLHCISECFTVSASAPL